MKVLIGFECSGQLRRRFQSKGADVTSCDLKPAEDGEAVRHLTLSFDEVVRRQRWDLLIAHPPCTALCVSGNAHYAKGKPRHDERLAAMAQVEAWWALSIQCSARVAFENPVGVIPHTALKRAAQYVQPYEFGDDASKKTGLWLFNLPHLVATERFDGRLCNGKERWGNQCDSGQNRLGPSRGRAGLRARTYSGIADAMADQWG